MAHPTDEREITLRRTERVYVRLALGIILGLVLLVAASWGGRRFYVRWQEHKLMRQAHVAFDKADLRWAAMAAQRAYALDPNSVDACRTLADIAQRQGGNQAIEWRRRAVAIDPSSVPDRLALANTALHFQQPAIAAEALAPIPAAQQNDAGYQAAMARIALTKNDTAAARTHLTAAAQFAPNDPQPALELAEYQLHSDDRAERALGHAAATKLKSNPKVALDALHVLLTSTLGRREDDESVALAKELEAFPEAPPADRLLALGVLKQFNDPAFITALTRLEAESKDSADSAARLINWMNSRGLSLLALHWSRELPPEMLGNLTLRFALADAYVQARDWPALTAMLKRGSWQGVEAFRLALQAKVARETGDYDTCEKDWAEAVAKAENHNERLDILQRLAFQWHWPEKGVAVLWLLAENPGTKQSALQALYSHYAAARDTSGLYRALTRLVDVLPDDPLVKNNYAQISLLLHADLVRAQMLAHDVHEAHPANPAFASTYAFSLFQHDDLKGALKVMDALTPAQLQDPSVATYYGIILAAAGEKPEAAKFLDAAGRAKLLPEEEALVAQARRTLARLKPGSGT